MDKQLKDLCKWIHSEKDRAEKEYWVAHKAQDFYESNALAVRKSTLLDVIIQIEKQIT